MQKLKLEVESLDVVSFETGEGETMRGTVEANSTPVIAATIILNAARVGYMVGTALA